MRDFVQNHPAYKQDSVVSEEISYDLVDTLTKITDQQIIVPDLLPSYSTKSVDNIPAALQKAQTYHKGKLENRNQGSNPSQSSMASTSSTPSNVLVHNLVPVFSPKATGPVPAGDNNESSWTLY